MSPGSAERPRSQPVMGGSEGCFSSREAGLTMLEVVIGMLILAIILAFGLTVISGLLSRRAEEVTFKRMEQVADSISLYAQKNLRVPCPADPNRTAAAEPFGTEFGSGAGGTNFGNCRTTAASQEGIIPFATLGIPEDMTRDAFGNFFTYRVSPTAAFDTTAIPAGTTINHWCLSEPVWHDGTNVINVPKSLFCCGAGNNSADWTQDVRLDGPYGLLAPSRELEVLAVNDAGDGNAHYQNQAAAPPGTADLTDNFVPSYVVYVLVSHGQNGLGAFGEGGVRTTAGSTAEELENNDGDRQFNVSDRFSPDDPGGDGGTDLFRSQIDDIVFWQSQAQVMSRVGSFSCTRP